MKEIKVFYLRNQHGHPVACVASTKADDAGTRIKFALSICNPLDPFVKGTAVQKATSRLKAEIDKYPSASPLDSEKNRQREKNLRLVGFVDGGVGVKTRVLSTIAHNKRLPVSARGAAKYWLSHAEEFAKKRAEANRKRLERRVAKGAASIG